MDIIEKLEAFLIKEIVVDLGVDKKTVAPDEDLLSQGIIDSMGILKLMDFMEKEFKINISDEDMEPENFKNLNSLKSFIESKL